MPIPHPMKLAAGLLAGLALSLGAGCASNQQSNARWLQRGEAEALLAAHAANPEKNPDPDRMPLRAGEMEAQGDILAAQGSTYNAMNNYRLALKEAKDPGTRLRLEGKLAGLELSLGNYAKAQKAFASLCSQQPGKAVFWQGQGLAQMGMGDLGGAEKSLQRAVGLEPSLWRAQNLLGVIYNRRGQPRRAIAAFRAALVSRPDNPALYNNLALAQTMAGDLRGAEASLRRALALDPEHRLAANNLGLLLARQGRDQEAFQVFAQAQGVAQAHNNLGVILAWQGRDKQAEEQFRLAVQTMPRYYPLATRHLNELASQPAQPKGRLASRPITPLARRVSAKAATPKASPAKSAPAAAVRSKTAAKTAAVTARAQRQSRPRPPLGSKPPATAKPAPQAKPAPLTKEQRMLSDAAPPQKAAAKSETPSPKEPPAKTQETVNPPKPKAVSANQAARPGGRPVSPSTQGKAAGLWMRADGSLSYGPRPAEGQAMGVVYGSGE